jgi:hypothetical protein
MLAMESNSGNPCTDHGSAGWADCRLICCVAPLSWSPGWSFEMTSLPGSNNYSTVPTRATPAATRDPDPPPPRPAADR